MPERIYISGPYTSPDPVANTARAMAVWHRLRDEGLHPICPHLTMLLHMHKQRDWEFWLTYDEEEIDFCDYVIRLPGDSKGADREVEYAKGRGIGVIYGHTDTEVIENLLEWLEGAA